MLATIYIVSVLGASTFSKADRPKDLFARACESIEVDRRDDELSRDLPLGHSFKRTNESRLLLVEFILSFMVANRIEPSKSAVAIPNYMSDYSSRLNNGNTYPSDHVTSYLEDSDLVGYFGEQDEMSRGISTIHSFLRNPAMIASDVDQFQIMHSLIAWASTFRIDLYRLNSSPNTQPRNEFPRNVFQSNEEAEACVIFLVKLSRFIPVLG